MYYSCMWIESYTLNRIVVELPALTSEVSRLEQC
jgi:hypothetical protein